MKEAYLTHDNRTKKAGYWLNELPNHSSRKARFQLNIASAALLVLDMQEFFLSKDSHAYVPSAQAILPNIQCLIELFRKKNRPVIFSRHSLEAGEDPGIMKEWWRDTVRDGSHESELTRLLVPAESDLILRKTRYSAFFHTGLEAALREKNIISVVITGVTTHLCCDSTARDAFMRDFEVYFVVDATATWTEDFHISSLKLLSDGFVIPLTTEDIVIANGDRMVR